MRVNVSVLSGANLHSSSRELQKNGKGLNCKNSPFSQGQADLIPAASTSVRAASRSNVDRAEAASFSGACSASDNASEEIMRITFDAQTVES